MARAGQPAAQELVGHPGRRQRWPATHYRRQNLSRIACCPNKAGAGCYRKCDLAKSRRNHAACTARWASLLTGRCKLRSLQVAEHFLGERPALTAKELPVQI